MSSLPSPPTCPTCDAPAAPEHTFCPHCGTRLKPEAAAPESIEAAEDDESQETAAVSADEVRTGLTLAVTAQAPEGETPPSVSTPPAETPVTGAAGPSPQAGPEEESHEGEEPEAAHAESPAAEEGTFIQPPADAATMIGKAADGGEPPGMDPTVMQPPHAATPAAGTRPDSSRRPGTGRPASGSGARRRTPFGSRTSGEPDIIPATQHMKPGESFGPRYRITQMLGVGGMGAVYKAWDSELEVTVAIKTIRPGVGTDADTALDAERRFKRELLLARQVTHPNVVRIYDLGEIERTKYITMSFVDGQDLASILAKEGKLPLSQALPIMRQVTAGMGAAHAAGIVHRDLKPANIMVDSSGQALVMDFGIARSVDPTVTEPTPAAGTPMPAAVEPEPKATSPPPHSTGLTSTASMVTHSLTVAGSVMGTLDYMAPEQAKGEAVDQRADVYALGLILRDMVLGRAARPKSGNAFQDLKQRMREPLPSAVSGDPEFPEALDQVMTRALALDPAERYPSSQELFEALEALDDEGVPKPIPKRRSDWWLAAAGVAIIVSGLGAWYFGQRFATPAAEHEPVAVLIADMQNETGDPTFDRALEPVLKLALEGAGFISAYDRSSIPRGLGVPAPDVLDETAARELAIKQGVGVVLSGALTRNGSRYAVAMKLAEAVTGNVITSDTRTASAKEAVLSTVTNLADEVRESLGDDTSDTAQRFAMEALSATSLDVVKEYAGAMEALSRSRFNEALEGFSRAVKLDSKFGLAYAGMAIASANLGRSQDAEKYVKQAITLVDGMTERERYRTRGLLYLITNDYQSCVTEYGDLIARYSADAAARNNRALCLSKLRDMPTAVEEMRQVVKILPNRGLYRVNLATYAAYAGDAETAEREARNAMDQSPWAPQALAFAQVLQGQVQQAADSYRILGKTRQVGPSYTASGLGDLALYEGRFSEAVRIFTEGAAADAADEEPDRAANKLAALAYTELQRARKPEAIAAAGKALESSQTRTIQFLAARVLVEAGAEDEAKRIAIALGNDLQPESQAYASIIDGMIAREQGDNRNAVRFLNEANTALDTWIGHVELGRAYLAANAFTQADSEFERCVNRRGEALALFLDEEPTYGMFPPVYYYQGRAREGLKSTRAADSFRAYLAIRGGSNEDPLVAEIRKVVGGQ